MADVEYKFEELRVYQKSLEFIDEVYDIAKDFSNDERFGLTSQYLRAAQSIALSLAVLIHNSIAQGSVRECVVSSTIAT